jgi:hypothetical protein
MIGAPYKIDDTLWRVYQVFVIFGDLFLDRDLALKSLHVFDNI